MANPLTTKEIEAQIKAAYVSQDQGEVIAIIVDAVVSVSRRLDELQIKLENTDSVK